jgi:hypothetical protein
MRCGEIAVVGLIAHPRYARLKKWREAGILMVKRRLEKRFDFWAVDLLIPADARLLLLSWVPRLIRTQRKTGLWKVRDASGISCGVLMALRHAGLLDNLLRDRSLRSDPLAPFRQGVDYHDVLVRRHILSESGEVDRAAGRLIGECLGMQHADGSWDSTVAGTCHHVDRLMRLGLAASDSHLRKAGRWLLRQCIGDVRRESSSIGGVVVAHSMFSGSDRASESRSALRLRPEWDPKAACFRHLPNIQNGLAIRTLVALGHASDARVLRACENLVELGRCYGGYCDTNIRKALETRQARAKSMTHRLT